MAPYIALTWRVSDHRAAAAAANLIAELTRDEAWRVNLDLAGRLVLERPERPVLVREVGVGRGMLIGDLFDVSGAAAPAAVLVKSAASASSDALARQILGQYWGRYVAVLTSAAGRPERVLRDPSGALDCFCWTIDGLLVVTSDPPDAALRPLAQRVSIAWDIVAQHLSDPSLISARSALNGIHTVTPGALRSFLGGEGEVQLWRPGAVAQQRSGGEPSAEAGLVQTLDRVVAALAGQRPVLAEVSGGLDSSMVASALKVIAADVRGWVTFVGADPGADERPYARALGRWLGFELTEIFKTVEPVTPDDIGATQVGAEISLNALDRQYDDHILNLAEALDAQVVFTGFGGDAVYFQMADPEVIEDLVARRGRVALLTPALGEIARWTRQSAYRLAWRALRSRWQAQPYPSGGLNWRRSGPPAQSHPWCADIGDLPPAKRLQITSLTHMLSGYGRSRRGARLDIVHPHLTQPVLEHALRTPVDMLVVGGRDRGLARRAFRGRLPGVILDRRSKGDLGVLHARNFVAGIPLMRPFLLEGLLVQHGLIDPLVLEAALDEASLAQHAGHLEILQTVATEAWARKWSVRLDGLKRLSAA